MPLKRFNPTSTVEGRAIQAWIILVSQAKNRQTITYKGLSLLMYSREAAGVLDKILGRILKWCSDNHLPPLPALVVNQDKGIPGIPYQNLDESREEVYRFDWYDLHPPIEEDLTSKEPNGAEAPAAPNPKR